MTCTECQCEPATEFHDAAGKVTAEGRCMRCYERAVRHDEWLSNNMPRDWVHRRGRAPGNKAPYA